VVIIEGGGAVLRVNLGHPISTSGDYVALLCESDLLFPNYIGEELFINRPFSCSLHLHKYL